MALHWDMTKVSDRDAWTDDQHEIATAVIWAMMVIGMGEITDANAEEFWVRIDHYQKVIGGLMMRSTPDGSVVEHITVADVQRLIGLNTNVWPKTTEAVFRKRMAEISADHSRRAWNLAKAMATVE